MASGKRVHIVSTGAIYKCLGLLANWGAEAQAKTKGRGSQRGEMVPDEPGGSLSSILWLWDQPQGSQGSSQQK